MGGNELVDKSSLSQRELLLLVADRQEDMAKTMGKLSKDYVDLHVRVAKIETKLYTVSVAIGVLVTIINVVINIYK